MVVLDLEPDGVSFDRNHLVLAVEVWSPSNTREERETKAAAYAEAGVPYFWSVELNSRSHRVSTVTAYRLERGRYIEEVTARPGTAVTITAAPAPLTFDPAYLTI